MHVFVLLKVPEKITTVMRISLDCLLQIWFDGVNILLKFLLFCPAHSLSTVSCDTSLNDVQCCVCFHPVIFPLFRHLLCFPATFLIWPVCVCLAPSLSLCVCLCSQKGLKNVFDEAILAALEPPEPKKKRKCVLLWEAPTFPLHTHHT